VPVKVTHNENETLSHGPRQQRTDIDRSLVYLDRRDPDSPLRQWLGQSPGHLAGGDGSHPVDLHDHRIIPDAHWAISFDGAARSDKTEMAIGHRRWRLF
jgi:hypothetical protein